MRGRRLVVFVVAACGGGGQLAFGDHPGRERASPAIRDGEGTETIGGDGEAAADEDPGPDVSYDKVIQKSVHNAYARSEPLIDQLVYHRIRSLELDIHTRQSGTVSPSGEWWVFHEDHPIWQATSCTRLSDCLGQVAAFHDALPRHEVVTLFVDLKTSFEGAHRPDDLDAAFVNGLGRERIVTPADVIAACPGATSLRQAVTGACHFPTLRALRGKFIVAITGGTSCDRSSFVSTYAGADPRARVAFVAPNADASSCTVAAYDARPDVVFFNMPLADKDRASEVKNRGLVARIYGGGLSGGLDVPNDFAAARLAGAAHLATDKVSFERDAWAASHRARGYPFTCDGCSDDLVEPGHLLGIQATSGDLWGTADSGVFAGETDDEDSTWSALVSVPSSHVEPFAKACLVARASTDAAAANVSVCRTFDDSAPRAQIRRSAGGATVATDASSFDGIARESPAFLRLAVKASGGASEVIASASRDGKKWSTITAARLDSSLPFRGVAVSAHGEPDGPAASVKGLFANLTRERAGTRAPMTTTTLEQKAIGAQATGQIFDGVFPP